MKTSFNLTIIWVRSGGWGSPSTAIRGLDSYDLRPAAGVFDACLVLVKKLLESKLLKGAIVLGCRI